MRRSLLLFLLVPALSGCATTAGYEKLLSSWVGMQEIDLVRTWGAPMQTYELDGHKFIVYVSQREVYYPGTPPTYQTTVRGDTAYITGYGGSPARSIDRSCRTTFEIEGTKIISWSFQGDDCRARE
ncbi:hypothetical protein ACUUL3_06975 [Thiovibrio sp. JS02]